MPKKITGRSNATVTRTAARRDVVARAVPREGAGPFELEARLVPWNEAARVSDDGRSHYLERWEPGGLVAGDVMPAYDGHVMTPRGLDHGPLIGRISSITARADGPYGIIQLADIPEARRVHELARVVGAHVSVEFEFDGSEPGADGVVVRSSTAPAMCTGVAVILPPQQPAYAGAVVTAVRSNTPTEDDTEEDTDKDKDDTEGEGEGAEGSSETGRAAIAELVRAEVARIHTRGTQARGAHPLGRFHTAGEMISAARTMPQPQALQISRSFHDAYHAHHQRRRAERIVGRALVDQITTDNPGLMPPHWLTEVFGIVDQGRPGITALGGPRQPGDSGMDIYWPYFDGDLTAIVAAQAAEKTAINSVKVSFKRGQSTLATYAGGSDVSYQLQRRSSPSYMALYDRILQLAYGIETEYVFDAELVAGAGATVVYDPMTGDPDGAGLKAALFEASAKVFLATGMPATAVLVAPDVFVTLGGQPWLQPPQYGTQNTPGVASASTLRINVSGLEITNVPGLAAGTMIVTNELAAAWFEDGPFLVTAEDVEKLGTNVAIWGMGADALFLPKGIVKMVPIAGTQASKKA